MDRKACVCVDLLGGDAGAPPVVAGALDALAKDEGLSLILVGPEEAAKPVLERFPNRVECVPTEVSIGMDEHPAQAIRTKKDSSIVLGCHQVKDGNAQAFFSAGSTGACLAAATLIIGRAQGVSRPVLSTVLPMPARPVVFGDVGANADCKAEYLLQFALMNKAFAERVLGWEDVQVGLLNNGTEDTKGSQFAVQVHDLLREKLPSFYGNVEGGDIPKATCQVVVTDGFTGNIALKSMEQLAKTLLGEVKKVFYSSTKSKVAGLLIKNEFSELKNRLSSDTYGGAPLLGLKGGCVIGHGSSSPEAITNGIMVAARGIRTDLPARIADAIAEL